MCGRFALYSNPKDIANIFAITQIHSIHTSYNVAPTENITVICEFEPGERIAVLMRWGLIPSWQTSIRNSAPLINARLETIDSKPAFRSAIRRRRCLIIANGFFEWQHSASGRKKPFFIHLKNDQPYAMAGIWERWVSDEQSIDSCCIITAQSPKQIYTLHDRAPVIVLPENYSAWLDVSQMIDIEHIKSLVSTFEEAEIEIYPVSSIVNKATYKGSDCISELSTNQQ